MPVPQMEKVSVDKTEIELIVKGVFAALKKAVKGRPLLVLALSALEEFVPSLIASGEAEALAAKLKKQLATAGKSK